MMHPDILLAFAKQRQREFWKEAEHAARVKQCKAATPRLYHRRLLATEDSRITRCTQGYAFPKSETANLITSDRRAA